MKNDPIAIARACLEAYADKDRAAIERLIAEDFHFTSPIDNRLDRATYFARCWPNSERMAAVEFVQAMGNGEHAFIVYEAETADGKRFRNAELYSTRNGQLVEVEVYFGWSLPHPAAPDGFVENDGEGHA